MDLIFKASGADPLLIKHSNFREHYPGIHPNTDWASFSPYISKAIRKHLLPWIGRELYDDLATKFQDDETLTTAQAETLELMQNAAAYYAVYQAMPFMNLQLTALGVQQSNDREGTSSPPSQWSFMVTRWNALIQADSSLDQLMQQLADQVAAETAYYDLYKNSAAFNYGASAFFRETQELDAFLNFQGSIRAYKSLIKYVAEAEKRFVKPVLGAEMYAELQGEVEANDLTSENATLLEFVRPLAAAYGLYLAIPHLTLVIESDGFKVVSQTDTMNNRRGLTTETHQRAIESLRQQTEENGHQARSDLTAFLYTNADDYPTFKNSSVYESYVSTDTTYESEDGKGAVFL